MEATHSAVEGAYSDPRTPSLFPEDTDDIISARSGPVDGTSGSTDSSPQHSDSANTTEDTTPDNSGAIKISATSEREQSGPVEESVVETRRYPSRQRQLPDKFA